MNRVGKVGKRWTWLLRAAGAARGWAVGLGGGGGGGGIGQIDIDLPRGKSGEQRPATASRSEVRARERERDGLMSDGGTRETQNMATLDEGRVDPKNA